MLDLDHFKNYNDKFGHQAGDGLLAEAARPGSKSYARPTCSHATVERNSRSRLPRPTAAHAEEAVGRVRNSTPRGQKASAGIACWDGEEEAHDLVARADQALYEAKRTGRDKTVVHGTTAGAR